MYRIVPRLSRSDFHLNYRQDPWQLLLQQRRQPHDHTLQATQIPQHAASQPWDESHIQVLIRPNCARSRTLPPDLEMCCPFLRAQVLQPISYVQGRPKIGRGLQLAHQLHLRSGKEVWDSYDR